MPKKRYKLRVWKSRKLPPIAVLQSTIALGLAIEGCLLWSWPVARAALVSATSAKPESLTELSFVSAQPVRTPLTPQAANSIPYRLVNQSATARTYHLTITVQPAGAPVQRHTETVALAAHSQRLLAAQVIAPIAKSTVALTITLSDPSESITYNLAS